MAVDTSARFAPLRWLRGNRRRWLARDLLAGVTAAAVVIAQAMAYATLAYAVLGTSRALSVSTTSTISILTATAIAGVAQSQQDVATAAATLAVVTGCILFVAGRCRRALREHLGSAILWGPVHATRPRIACKGPHKMTQRESGHCR